MSSIADTFVIIQSSSQEVPHPPSWFGEVVLIVTYLCKQGILSKICERVRCVRPRFGRYEGAT